MKNRQLRQTARRGVNRRHYRRERGVSLIWTALFAMILIGFAGLATDMGYLSWVERQLQAAADAAALAGAEMLANNPAGVRTQVATIASLNTAAGQLVSLDTNAGNAADGDIVLGTYNTTTNQFTATVTAPNAVKVVARRTAGNARGPVSLFFGPIFGLNTVSLSRSAIATIQSTTGPGLLLLAPTGPGVLSESGNGSLNVAGGNAYVDSNDSQAVQLSGNAHITADNVDIVGGYSFTANAGVTGHVNTGSSVMADPLAGLAAPTVTTPNGGTISLSANQSQTISPGYYPGGISLSGNASITLNPGIYNLGGAGISISGNGQIRANGVLLYVSGTGRVNLSGNGAVVITPPNPALYSFPGVSTYAGISIYQDRADAQSAAISGNGNMNIDGAIYAPSAAANLSGNGGTLGSEFIVKSAVISGNGSITINYATGTKPGVAGGNPYLVR